MTDAEQEIFEREKMPKIFFCQECQNVIVAASVRKTLKNSCQEKFELNQKTYQRLFSIRET